VVAWHQPLRAVLDRRLRLAPRGRLFGPGGRLLVYTAESAAPDRMQVLRAAGAEVIALPEPAGPAAALAHLAGLGVNDVLVEAGPTLAGAFLAAHLVDELVIYLAPSVLGNGGRGMFELPDRVGLDARIRLRILEVRAVGEDWRVRAAPVQQETEAP